jgi:transcriptional regulator with XRE-family HTH domain
VKINHTFGTFIKEKRKERGISLRRFAEEVGISPVYLSNLENDRMNAPKDDVVSNIARLLKLTEADTAILYDLAAKAKNSVVVPQDLPDYIMDRDIVRVALRTAKDVDATDEEWQEFIAQLKARRRNKQEGE